MPAAVCGTAVVLCAVAVWAFLPVHQQSGLDFNEVDRAATHGEMSTDRSGNTATDLSWDVASYDIALAVLPTPSDDAGAFPSEPPPIRASSLRPEFQLIAVFTSAEAGIKSAAIYDPPSDELRFVTPGDVVGTARIVAIDDDGVTVASVMDDREVVLPLETGGVTRERPLTPLEQALLREPDTLGEPANGGTP